MTRAVAVLSAASAAWLLQAGAVTGQTLAVEVTQSAGTSSESISALGTQVRLLGEAVPGLRWNVEGAWATRSRDESDVFGAAYPYEGRAEIIEAYGEFLFAGTRGLRAVKAGRYRTPFGIASSSDHAYIGFHRPPLVRYGEYFALSSGYLEHGVDVVVGVPRLSVEASVGLPADVGSAIRRSGVNTVARAEAAAGALIVGASVIDTTPYLPERFARGRARFAGVDARWMKGGVMVRGEWLAGQPFDGTRTTGGYADVIVHRPFMGPVTALARAERLAYDAAPPHALYSQRYSAGARVRLWKSVAVSAGVVYQAGQVTQRRRTALDLGLTGSFRRDYGTHP
ncbi:MAG: hypothetical protein AB7Q16_14270 [Vicinamibacterales bacterium]